jgi:hypothetical protein
VAVALFGARALHGRERGSLSNDPTDRAFLAAQVVALVLVAAGVAWARVRARRMRAELTRLVVDLGQSPPPGGLRDQLAEAFGDPSLDLLHAQDDGMQWIDGSGLPADLEPDSGRQVTRLLAGGRELSAVVHRAGASSPPRTPSAARSSGTCTTARSSGSRRSRSPSGSHGDSWHPRIRTWMPSWLAPKTGCATRWPSCASLPTD